MKKYILFSILFLFNIFLSFSENEENEITLLNELKNTTSNEKKINILTELARLNFNTSKEVNYCLDIISISDKTKNHKVTIKSYRDITRNYYNRDINDSVMYYMKRLEPIAMEHKFYFEFCSAFSYLCFIDIHENRFENVLSSVKKLQDFAKATNDYNFNLIHNIIMGKMYVKIENYEKGQESFLNAIRIIEENNATRISLKAQLYIYMIETSLHKKELDEANYYIDIFEDYVNKDIESESSSLPEDWCRKFCTIFRLFVNIQKGDLKISNKYVEELKVMPKINDWYVEKSTHYALFEFYLRMFDCENAKNEILKALEYKKDDSSLLSRLFFFYGMKGEYEKANEILSEYLENQKNNYDKRVRNNVDNYFVNEEINNIKTESAHLKVLQQKSLYKLTIIITVFIFIVIIVMIIFYVRSRKMKTKLRLTQKELIKERNDLLRAKSHMEMARDKANESNRLKSSFLANMSHELRTPLNAIAGFSELISSSASEESLEKEYSEIIKMNSDLLIKLINNILDLSRLDSKIININNTKNDVVVFAKYTLDSFAKTIEKDLEFEFISLYENLIITTDYHKLKQILNFVLENAAKFTDEGKITLELFYDGDRLKFYIRDTGCGIPDDKRELIFERFEKLDDFSTGAGLGLSICRSIVEKLNGTIILNPEYKDGAEFIIDIDLT